MGFNTLCFSFLNEFWSKSLNEMESHNTDLCILHKNNQNYCSKSEECCIMTSIFRPCVAWLLYIFYLYRLYSSGIFHISWYIMDLQDVYCLMNSFCVCLSLIIQKHRTILICPLMEKCFCICMVYKDFISNIKWTPLQYCTLSEWCWDVVIIFSTM